VHYYLVYKVGYLNILKDICLRICNLRDTLAHILATQHIQGFRWLWPAKIQRNYESHELFAAIAVKGDIRTFGRNRVLYGDCNIDVIHQLSRFLGLLIRFLDIPFLRQPRWPSLSFTQASFNLNGICP
jgi:hypothetical protein